MSAPGSTPATRWGMPAVVIWASLMLSAWIHTDKLPEDAEVAAATLALVFLSAPAAQIIGLLGLRAALARRPPSRNADLLVLWLMTFLFGLHAAVLAVAIGMLSSLGRAVPLAVSLLLLGVGPVLAFLEPGSPLGIRTRATLADPAVWRRAHRFAAGAFVLAGLVAPLGLLLEGVVALYAAVAPALLVVAVSILRAGMAGGGRGR